jgi:uncharacterized protein
MTQRSSATFAALLAQRLSRRDMVAGSALAATGLGLAPLSQAAPRLAGTAALPRLAPSKQDALLLAPGYRHDVVARWGDALFKGAAAMDARGLSAGATQLPGAAAAQQRQFGTNCDGLAYFPMAGTSSRRGLLCVNHEYVRFELSFIGQPLSTTERIAQRQRWITQYPQAVPFMQAAHGVSVVHVERRSRGWQIGVGGPLTRRITANTPCDIAGPARGAPLLRTAADPDGVRVLGTFANCAGGKTPWGTYLTAEENIDDYFGFARSWGQDTEDFALLAAHARFPLAENSAYGWEHADRRFDVRAEPREALRFGWIVEIDPQNPAAPPKKRTALGRFSHEAATTRIAKDGRIAAYMGDDDKFEYVYKFVTRDRFDAANRAANLDLLDTGTLFVARFDADGRGEWLSLVWDAKGPLNAAAGFASQADVVIKARAAADALGATPMDRPEDVEASPITGRVYITCTRNADRSGERQRDFYTNREIELGIDAANPRSQNDYGHIIELIEDGDDAAANRFRWQVFLLAGDPRAAPPSGLTLAASLQPA